MYYIVSNYMISFCIVLHCIRMYHIILYCIAFYCIVFYCNRLYIIILYLYSLPFYCTIHPGNQCRLLLKHVKKLSIPVSLIEFEYALLALKALHVTCNSQMLPHITTVKLSITLQGLGVIYLKSSIFLQLLKFTF